MHEGGYTITGNPNRELIFRRPDGRRVSSRPVNRAGSAPTLKQLNHRHGIHPGPITITPNWHGDNLDLEWAVTVLLDDA